MQLQLEGRISEMMKAIVLEKPGPPEALRYVDVPRDGIR